MHIRRYSDSSKFHSFLYKKSECSEFALVWRMVAVELKWEMVPVVILAATVGIIMPVVCWCRSQVATWMSRWGRSEEILKRLEVKVDKIHRIVTEPRPDIPRWHSHSQYGRRNANSDNDRECDRDNDWEREEKPHTKNEDKQENRPSRSRSRSRSSKKKRYNCN